jgi:hypothetical protein
MHRTLELVTRTHSITSGSSVHVTGQNCVGKLGNTCRQSLHLSILISDFLTYRNCLGDSEQMDRCTLGTSLSRL